MPPLDGVGPPDLLARASAILHEAGATRVWLFGSRARGALLDRRSDLDLAVEGLGEDTARTLARQLRHELGVLTHVVPFERPEPSLRHAVQSACVLLPPPGTDSDVEPQPHPQLSATLHRLRTDVVRNLVLASGARSVVDLGCGTGALVIELALEPQIRHVLGIEPDRRAMRRLHAGLARRLQPAERRKVDTLVGLATNADPRTRGFDVALAVEVVEHLDPGRLDEFADAVFRTARPSLVVLTTPNREYNAVWKSLADGGLRIADHQFEWTRAEAAEWAEAQATRHGYRWTTAEIGPAHPEHGAPSQLLAFQRRD
jgi:SAM-dependent methyltransferase